MPCIYHMVVIALDDLEYEITLILKGVKVPRNIWTEIESLLCGHLNNIPVDTITKIHQLMIDEGLDIDRDGALRLALSYLYAKNALKYGPKPVLTVDGIVVLDSNVIRNFSHGPKTFNDRHYVCLIKRGKPPYKGEYALPGGFVDYGELPEDAVLREVREECSIECRIRALVGIYGCPKRDPRWHTITLAYLLTYESGVLTAKDDAAEIEIVALNSIPEKMAFDHKKILKDAIALFNRMENRATFR